MYIDMKTRYLLTALSIVASLTAGTTIMAQKSIEKDTIMTGNGPVEMWFLGHGTLMFTINGEVIHIDPYSAVADYSKLPAADLILITHQHGDHLDLKAIDKIRKSSTVIICNALSSSQLPGAKVMKNGDRDVEGDITIEAVPAYNIKHERSPGNPYHPRGEGNGYVLTIGGKKIYVAGDTENIPEMAKLKDIYVAFLPMNLPYTMTPEMVADAIKMFNPAILYPYHYGDTDATLLLPLVDRNRTEVRIRDLK
jgi:L-ascorbate metabolism protein UlaG (beta-lactamase superfamily)